MRLVFRFDLNPDRVVVTSGSSGGFILAFTALFDTGDRVGIGAPGYPSYRQILRALDLVPVDLPTAPENRLQPVPADVAGLDRRDHRGGHFGERFAESTARGVQGDHDAKRSGPDAPDLLYEGR